MHPYELPQVHYTVVRVAKQQMGVGGDDSWGAQTHPEYLIPIDKNWSLPLRLRESDAFSPFCPWTGWAVCEKKETKADGERSKFWKAPARGRL